MSALALLKSRLEQAGLVFEDDAAADGLVLVRDDLAGLVELGADGRLVVLFGVDMDELRTLVSGDATEDLSDDELARVARDHLRPTVNAHKPWLKGDGFEEGLDTSANHYAITFTKNLNPIEIEPAVAAIVRSVRRLSSLPAR
jgi:hypothetical protein